MAREAAQQGYTRVICVGGDGTLNEIVNGLMQVEVERRPALGLIPSGTGTDFARGLGWPKALDGVIEAIRRGTERRIDVGMTSFYRAGQARARYFINVAGAGFDGDVSDVVNREGKHGGSLAYFLTVFRVLAGYEHKHARVTLTAPDGSEHVLQGHYNLIAVGNGQYFGGGMRISPNSDTCDGCFEAIVIEAMSRAEFVLNFPKVYRGTHLSHPKVSEYRVVAIRIELVNTSQRMFVEAEGELFGEAPASFQVIPGALRLIAPSGLLQSRQ